MALESTVILFLTTLLGATLLLFCYIQFIVYTYWKRNGIYQYSSYFPFGKAWPLLWERQHLGDFFYDIYSKMRKEGRTFAGFYLISKPQLMITDPEDVKLVLAKDFSYFRDRGIWCNEHIDPLSANLLSLPADRWKNIRGKLSPFFTPNRMKNIFPTMEECGPTLIEVIENYISKKEAFDMKELIWRFSAKIIGSVIFGVDFNTMNDPEDQAKLVGKDIFEPDKWEAVKRPFFFLMPDLLKFFRISSNSKLVTDFFMNIAKETIIYRTENNINRQDLIQILVDSIKKEDSTDGLTFNEIAAQCWVFFAGGFETASGLISFSTYELSKNQEIQDKLRAEVLEVLKAHNGKFTYEALNDMKYTEKVIKESLRKYPSLPFLNRKCTKLYKFPNSGVTVRPGDAIIIPVLGLQRDPEYYPNPDQFNPDRFNDDNYVNPYTFLPFGEGPRNCIALRMGMIQGKYTLALLISKFRFTCNEKTKLPLQWNKNTFTITVDGGIWLNAEKI